MIYVQHYISGRPLVSLWTYNMTSVASTGFYGRTTCGHGRPPVTICMYNITSMDAHQFHYGLYIRAFFLSSF